jgi:hypothetical protein
MIETFILIIMAIGVTIAKACIVNKIVLSDLKDNSDLTKWMLLGIRFYDNADLTYSINWTLTVIADAIAFGIALFYLLYLSFVKKSLKGKACLI